ncbi:MAG: nitroreductase family protein [Candidatus Bathyarchaeales archaeon]
MLAARSLGLGSCWLLMLNKDKLKALFKYPVGNGHAGVITLG